MKPAHLATLAVLCCALRAPAEAATDAAPPPPSSQPLTLEHCYQLALKRSETIAIQQELLKETEGRFLQAFSGVLPRASFSSSDKRQDGSGSSAFTLKEVPERKFTFSQPLFAGFKEFAAMAGSRAQRRQRRHEKTRAEHLLLVDVANAFHLLLEEREDLGALETIRTALLDRIEELSHREQLGRSRRSEVVSAEAQLRRMEAELEDSRGAERTARQLLAFLTGLDTIEAVADDEVLPTTPEPEERYVAKAALRPDVQAAQEAWQVANKQVAVVRGAAWPTVDVEGNYYVDRAGAAEDGKWDVALLVDVPIFQGGKNLGAVKEATSQARAAELQFERAERSAALDIRDAYAELEAALARMRALELALSATEENYRLQTEDYRLNLVSNLDVLKALEELQDTHRDVIHARHEAKRLYWRLRVATGETL